MTASALWTAVKASYDEQGLLTLTNIRDRAATAIDDTAGEDAAQEVIDLWPSYAQTDYDATDSRHVAIGKHAVIAVLWRRGGTAAGIAQVRWDEVFSQSGMIASLRRTDARARSGPKTNANTTYSSWSSRDALPHGILPSRRRNFGD